MAETEQTWLGLAPEAWAAWAAFILSIYLWIEQKLGQKRLRHLESLQANGTMLNEAWKQLALTPEALKFHSIDPKQLEAAGLTVAELSYLLINFQAADHYYQHKDKKTGPFSVGSLRYNILSNSKSRQAWPFMKPFFVASDRYVQRIEATITFFERVEKQQKQLKGQLNRI
jgi:hypothetical protein